MVTVAPVENLQSDTPPGSHSHDSPHGETFTFRPLKLPQLKEIARRYSGITWDLFDPKHVEQLRTLSKQLGIEDFDRLAYSLADGRFDAEELRNLGSVDSKSIDENALGSFLNRLEELSSQQLRSVSKRPGWPAMVRNAGEVWKTELVSDWRGKKVCGSIVVDREGNVLEVEGAELLSPSVKFGRDNELSIRTSSGNFRIFFNKGAPLALPLTPRDGRLIHSGKVYSLKALSDDNSRSADTIYLALDKQLECQIHRTGRDPKQILRQLVFQGTENDAVKISVENRIHGLSKNRVFVITELPESIITGSHGGSVESLKDLFDYNGNFALDSRLTDPRSTKLVKGGYSSKFSRENLSHIDAAVFDKLLELKGEAVVTRKLREIASLGLSHLLSESRLELGSLEARGEESSPRAVHLRKHVAELSAIRPSTFQSLNDFRNPTAKEALYHGTVALRRITGGEVDRFIFESSEKSGERLAAERKENRHVHSHKHGHGAVDLHHAPYGLNPLGPLTRPHIGVTTAAPLGKGFSVGRQFELLPTGENESFWTVSWERHLHHVGPFEEIDLHPGYPESHVGATWGSRGHRFASELHYHLFHELVGSLSWTWGDPQVKAAFSVEQFEKVSGLRELVQSLADSRPLSPAAEKLRRDVAAEAERLATLLEVEPGDTARREELFLRVLNSHRLNVQTAIQEWEARGRRGKIVGVTFGVFVEGGAVIPFAGPVFQTIKRMDQHFSVGLSNGDVTVQSGEFIPPDSTPAGNTRPRRAFSEPQILTEGSLQRGADGNVLRFNAASKDPFNDRTRYVVETKGSVSVEAVEKSGIRFSTNVADVQERIQIGVDGRRTVYYTLATPDGLSSESETRLVSKYLDGHGRYVVRLDDSTAKARSETVNTIAVRTTLDSPDVVPESTRLTSRSKSLGDFVRDGVRVGVRGFTRLFTDGL